jgi:hypothetical protein
LAAASKPGSLWPGDRIRNTGDGRKPRAAVEGGGEGDADIDAASRRQRGEGEWRASCRGGEKSDAEAAEGIGREATAAAVEKRALLPSRGWHAAAVAAVPTDCCWGAAAAAAAAAASGGEKKMGAAASLSGACTGEVT